MQIQAGPTKEFFIDMITKDIQLEKAILDLIDNSIDGAKNTGVISDKKIELSINQNEFKIYDNCGGFSLETAHNYAFQFGRSEKSTSSDDKSRYSIGRFGVGMKRTLFKLGKKFFVESRTKSEHFTVEVDVEEWKNDTSPYWKFELVEHKYENKDEWTGTRIVVTDLNDDIIKSFSESELANTTLYDEIGYSYSKLINEGLKISINENEIAAKDVEMILDKSIKPYIRKLEKDDVTIHIIAGIGKAWPADAGWYVYGNDRLLLMADKSKVTGWGTKNEDLSLPQFHASKAMFRGIVFMSSKDVTKLPLTTTKVGVDVDSELYKTVLYYMGLAMKEIFLYLNKINDKSDRDEIYNQHSTTSVFSIRRIFSEVEKSDFLFGVNIDTNVKDVKIIFSKPKDLADKVKKEYGLSSYKEVGEYAFDYLVDMECL